MTHITLYAMIFLGSLLNPQNSTIFREPAEQQKCIQGPSDKGKSTIEVGEGSGVFFTYSTRNTKIIMKPCDSLPETDAWFCPEPIYSRNWKVATLRYISDNQLVTLYFSPGPSADPEFILVGNSGKIIGRIAALKLEITEDFQVFSSGHTNTMFDKKRSFTIQADTLSEIKQAFYEVGIQGKLKRNLQVYCDDSFSVMQQFLIAGSEIEILLAKASGEEDFYEKIYLIKGEAGIVGYIRLTDEDTFGGLIDGLYYAGD